MQQKAKTVAAETVSEHVHSVGVTNVFHPLETAGRTEFLAPDNLHEKDAEQH